MTYNGKNIEYGREFAFDLIKETKTSNGPLSNAFNNRNDENITKKEIVGNALIFSFAGHDTTANTLTWLIYELSKNIELQEKLQNEVDIFWENQNNKEIVYKDFKRLPFMTRCIMETLRLWTPIPNGTFRELIEDDYITGINGQQVLLSKGTYIQIPNWTRHRNKELWGDDVNTFNPNREFIDDELWNNTVINIIS